MNPGREDAKDSTILNLKSPKLLLTREKFRGNRIPVSQELSVIFVYTPAQSLGYLV